MARTRSLGIKSKVYDTISNIFFNVPGGFVINRNQLPLLPFEKYGAIGDILKGKRIFYAHSSGNAGDTLIHAGAYCLFEHFNIELTYVLDDADAFVWGGGGNLGTMYKRPYRIRKKLIALAEIHKKPVIIFPQSITNSKEQIPERAVVFVREEESLKILSGSKHLPDTAFAYNRPIDFCEPIHKLGVFLREDIEQAFMIYSHLSLGDIAKLCTDYLGYFKIAGLFEVIVTDRLHFAIAALMVGRQVVLLPNSYFKNEAIYDSWLRPLGCLWGTDTMFELVKGHQYDPTEMKEWNVA